MDIGELVCDTGRVPRGAVKQSGGTQRGRKLRERYHQESEK